MSNEPNRYFVVNQGSYMHNALNAMEDAGTRIVRNFDHMEANANTFFGYTIRGVCKAVTVVSNSKSAQIPMLAPILGQAFSKESPEAFTEEDFFTGILYLEASDLENAPEDITGPWGLRMQLDQIEKDVGSIGLNPNWLIKITAPENAPKTDDPAKAVLTVNKHSFYPEAYKVFGDWVIKMPVIISEYGNTYVPPQSELVDGEKIQQLTANMPLENFRHDHANARARIAGLKTFEISPR